MEMSKNMCGKTEETYGEIRHIKWEEIVQERQNRNGKVVDETECGEDCSECLDLLQLSKEKLNEIKKWMEDRNNQLNETAGEINRMKKKKAVQKTQLQEKEEQLTKMVENLGALQFCIHMTACTHVLYTTKIFSNRV